MSPMLVITATNHTDTQAMSNMGDKSITTILASTIADLSESVNPQIIRHSLGISMICHHKLLDIAWVSV